MTIEYLIAGAVLFLGGAVQRWLHRDMAAHEEAGGAVRGWWTVALGWVAMLLGVILLAAGVAGR